MSQEPGDRYLGHGDHATRSNSTGSTIEQGKWVGPTGDEDVAPADANGGPAALAGVVSDDHPDGEYGRVHLRGLVWARVDSGVTANDELAVPDSSGTDTPGVPPNGGSSGVIAMQDATEYKSTGNYYALCLVR